MTEAEIKALVAATTTQASLELTTKLNAQVAEIQAATTATLNSELANFQNAVAGLIERKLAPLQSRLFSLIDEVAKNKADSHTLDTATQQSLLSLQDDLNLLRIDTARQVEGAALAITQAHVARLMRRSEQQ